MNDYQFLTFSCWTQTASLGSSWTGHDMGSMAAVAERGETPSYKSTAGPAAVQST